MYAALDKNGILTYAQQAVENKDYFCCHCEKKVKLIWTDSRKYFRHENRVDNDINERSIHIKGKELLLNILKTLNIEVRSEVYLTKIQQRPDILVNNRVALEYQCAKIDVNVLRQRVLGYQRMGITSIWILGGNYFSQQVKKEHLKFIDYNYRWGFYLLMLNSVDKQLNLFHHIKFIDPFNKIFAQKEIFHESRFKDVFSFQPEVCHLEAQEMNEYLLNKLRGRNDVRSRQIKMEFYNEHQITVEDYLEKRVFLPIPPVYKSLSWQIVCGYEKTFLEQPLLNFRHQKKPPQL